MSVRYFVRLMRENPPGTTRAPVTSPTWGSSSFKMEDKGSSANRFGVPGSPALSSLLTPSRPENETAGSERD